MTKALARGKIDPAILQRAVFDQLDYHRPEVLDRSGLGRDCAAIDFGEYICVSSTDPISAAVEDIGRLAVNITCNDIATNGIAPIGLLLAVLLPEGTTEEDLTKIMKQAKEVAQEHEVEIVGGHTEITSSVNQPVIVSTAIGRAPKRPERKAEAGDWVILTGSAGIEGTGIIANDLEDELLDILSEEELERAKAFINETNVIEVGKIAAKVGFIGMHDPTEGGVLGAFYELCEMTGTGGEIYDVPVHPVTEKIAKHYGINPLRLISSGAMLIVTSPKEGKEMLEVFHEKGISASRCGTILAKEKGVRHEGELIGPPQVDELFKAIPR